MPRNEVTLREALVDKLEGLIATTTSKMVSGQITDFVAYREQVARIKAVKDAVDIINDVFRSDEDNE